MQVYECLKRIEVMIMNNPCKDCKDRKVGKNYTCHKFCKKYISWKTEHESKRQELLEKAKIDKASYSIEESMNIQK